MTDQMTSQKRLIAVGQMGKAVKTVVFEPQIALVNDRNWAIIAPYMQRSGLIGTLSLEDINCPTVLTTGIIAKNTLDKLIRSYVSIEGVKNVRRFIHELEQIGGIVNYPNNSDKQ